MGNYLSTLNFASRRKRTHSQAEMDDDTDQSEARSGPKRRKMKSTSEYIYETLFKNGENSDVTICAFEREWHLHKIYLCQAGFFRSLFKGSWKESLETHVDLPCIDDENVTEEALTVALGSLYRDEILIDPSTVVNLLATASLLNLEALIQQCAEIMLEGINSSTACHYYIASQAYGAKGVPEKCIEYLQRTLMPNLTVQLLKDIVPEMMLELVGSANLFVMQVEMDVYSMLRKWLYLMLNPNYEGSFKDLLADTDAFIKSEVANRNWTPSFLDTPQGATYEKVFSTLRIEHIITDHPSAKVLEDDHILPLSWLLRSYRGQWLQLLKVDSGHDIGPKDFDVETFEKKSMRCGRQLETEGQYCWRWTGFNYGIDILISCLDHRILLKRNTDSSNCHGAIAPQTRRHIVYRLTVTDSSADAGGGTPYTTTTGIQHLSLCKDEEVCILTIERKISYPIYISCSFLLYTPLPSTAEGPEVSDVAPEADQQPLPALPSPDR